jgi:flagellar basal-body rod protein FlgC
MFSTLDINASALLAQRTRLDTIAQNIANARTTRDANGRVSPYRRRFVVFQSGQPGNPAAPGVRASIAESSDFRLELDIGHPDADSQGYVKYPNIDSVTEYVNALEASRAYEANVTTMDVTKAMVNASLRILA